MSLQYPLLTIVPDFANPPKRGISTMHDRTGYGPATQTVYFPQNRPDYLFAFRFAFGLALPIQSLKEFFRAQGGRTHPFYLPTWQRDLTLVGPVAAGEKQIPIISPEEDYEATHLTDQPADHYGRTIFFYKEGQVVFAQNILRVLPGDNPGEEILDIDYELPWAIDELTLVGWCHLVRFGDDRLEWQHLLPEVAETEITFRGMRGVNLNAITQPVDQLDQYGQLGFTECTLAPGEAQPVTDRVAYAYGPANLHATQDDPYYKPWAVWPESDGVRIRTAIPPANETIWIPNLTGTLCFLFDDPIATDHISLAFDQNAYEVVAYQLSASTIEIRRFFNTAVEIVSFPGVDPVLQFNGLLDATLDTGDTDVVCYYLKPGDNSLWMRFQRDNFGTEYLAAILPLRPLALKRAYFVYDEDEHGYLHVELVDAGFRVCTLISAQYPDPPPPPPPPPEVPIALGPEFSQARIAIVGGDYSYAVAWWDGLGEFDPHPAIEEAATATASLSGEFVSSVVYADGEDLEEAHPPMEDAAEASATITGTYALVVVSPEDDLHDDAEATITLSGTYAEYAIPTPPCDENALGRITLTGIYEPA